jgi:hypothetical protein
MALEYFCRMPGVEMADNLGDEQISHPCGAQATGKRVAERGVSRPAEFHHRAESARGIAPRAAHRSGLEPLDSSGSCHPLKAAACRRDQRVPPVAR